MNDLPVWNPSGTYLQRYAYIKRMQSSPSFIHPSSNLRWRLQLTRAGLSLKQVLRQAVTSGASQVGLSRMLFSLNVGQFLKRKSGVTVGGSLAPNRSVWDGACSPSCSQRQAAALIGRGRRMPAGTD